MPPYVRMHTLSVWMSPYIWMVPVCLDAPMLALPPYFWMPPVCLGAPYVCTPLCIVDSPLVWTPSVCLDALHMFDFPLCMFGCCQMYSGIPRYEGHPNMGASKHTRGIQAYRGHPNIWGVSKHTWGIKACFLCVVYVQGASKHQSKYTGGIKHMGVSKHMGASKHMGVSKHTGGFPACLPIHKVGFATSSQEWSKTTHQIFKWKECKQQGQQMETWVSNL